MQLGSGTWDALTGVIYTQRQNNLSWGAQWRGTFRLEDENDQGYSLGDKNIVTGWLAHQWAPWISTSGRIFYTDQDSIDGIDPVIVAPVQTANPNFQGGERVDLISELPSLRLVGGDVLVLLLLERHRLGAGGVELRLCCHVAVSLSRPLST